MSKDRKGKEPVARPYSGAETELVRGEKSMEKKTPLYERHLAGGGKMVPFAGHLLPVQYPTGVIREHMAVRQACGLFDVSHMGEVRYRGKDALANLQRLLTNDFSNMPAGKVRYSVMTDPQGGVIDDLLVYCMGEEDYWVVVNAANRQKDVEWMEQQRFGSCQLTDMSDRVAQLALQGPRAEVILRKLAPQLPEAYYTFLPQVRAAGMECLISRTGYTGEDGFELYCAPEDAPRLWDALLETGRDEGLIPCGLGARDTLRMEAAMPLYGHEMDETVTPFEAGLGWAVKTRKAEFIGRQALLGREEPARRRVGLEITGRGIAREHCVVYRRGERIGETTSGTHCPYLGRAVAMALVDGPVEAGEALEVDIRGRRVDARIVPLPFYKRAE